MHLQACLNGARNAKVHDRLATEVGSMLVEEAVGAVAAGAHSLHVHPKDRGGRDSLHPGDVGRWVSALRDSCPGVPIGVTTGEWAAPDTSTRHEWIAAWDLRPDFASVNWHEDGAEEVAQLLLDRAVGVEAGIWHSQAARAFAAWPSRDACFRVLVEVPDFSAAEARREARRLIDLIRAAVPRASILLHGEERSAWPVLDLAFELGLDTRIGLEDTLLRPDGSRAEDNAELVHIAYDRFGRPAV